MNLLRKISKFSAKEKIFYTKLSVFLYFLFLMGLSGNFLSDFKASFFLVPIFLWATCFQKRFSPQLVFFTSFIQDSLYEMHFGSSGFEWFLIFYFVSYKRYKILKKSILIQMAMFSCLVVFDAIYTNLIMPKNFCFLKILIGSIITILSYPFLSKFLIKLYSLKEVVIEK